MRVLVFCATDKTPSDVTLHALAQMETPANAVVDILIQRDNPHKELPTLNIVHQYKQMWERALSGGYDYVLTVEHDIAFPLDGLVKLLEVNAPIVYGIYHMRHGPTFAPNVVTPSGGGLKSKDWKRHIEAGKPVECGGYGYGFTLIRRDVLERFEIRTEATGADSDTVLCHDLQKAGMKQYAHFGVLCGHQRPDGATLWPSSDMYKPRWSQPPVFTWVGVKALHTFAGRNELGELFRIDGGQVGQITDTLARTLVTAGICEYA